MVDSEWLDIAISVALVWFVFAIAVSALNEALTRALALRSKQLWKALGQMLDGSDKPAGLLRNLRDLVAWHGRPSDPADAATVTAQLYGTATVQSVETRTDPGQKTRIRHIPNPVFSQALLEVATRGGGRAQEAIDEFLGSPSTPEPLRRQLGVLWATAERDVRRFRSEVEDWFDGQMARLSTIYKDQVRVVLAGLGVLVAVVGFVFGLRTDAFGLVSDFQHDRDLRTIVVSAATTAASSDLAKLGCPPASTTTTAPSAGAAAGASDTACAIKGLTSLKGIDLAVRGGGPPATASRLARLRYLHHLRALLGVIVTGVAISFGSTFWYSVVQRLVGLRGAGRATHAT